MSVDGELIDGTQRRWVGSVLSTGFDEKVNWRTNHLPFNVGAPSYAYSVFAELRTFRPLQYRIEVDGSPRDLKAILVAVGNAGVAGGGIRICPDVRVDDGPSTSPSCTRSAGHSCSGCSGSCSPGTSPATQRSRPSRPGRYVWTAMTCSGWPTARNCAGCPSLGYAVTDALTIPSPAPWRSRASIVSPDERLVHHARTHRPLARRSPSSLPATTFPWTAIR